MVKSNYTWHLVFVPAVLKLQSEIVPNVSGDLQEILFWALNKDSCLSFLIYSLVLGASHHSISAASAFLPLTKATLLLFS